jgi:hypothetical protein
MTMHRDGDGYRFGGFPDGHTVKLSVKELAQLDTYYSPRTDEQFTVFPWVTPEEECAWVSAHTDAIRLAKPDAVTP